MSGIEEKTFKDLQRNPRRYHSRPLPRNIGAKSDSRSFRQDKGLRSIDNFHNWPFFQYFSMESKSGPGSLKVTICFTNFPYALRDYEL